MEREAVMKVKNCHACRKQIMEEARSEYLKHEYAIFKDAAYTMAVYSTVAALAVQARRGRSKDYIKTLYDDMIAIMDTESFFGKPITMSDLMKTLEQDYDIDFKRIQPNLESEKDFIKGVGRHE